MVSVEKFILSGNWKLVTDKGKITNFTSEFYTGPVNGANNHTHQLTNLRIQDEKPVQLSDNGSVQISRFDVKDQTVRSHGRMYQLQYQSLKREPLVLT